MSDGAAAAAAATEGNAPSAASVLTTIVLVLGAIAARVVADSVLARLDRSARRAEAAREFLQAARLDSAGQYDQAVNRYRSAIALDRSNRGFRLGLARALMAGGRLVEADSTLAGMLRDDATDGAANLALARVLVREGRIPEATSYYHRAMYGRWDDRHGAGKRLARLELIDLLARTGAKEELLAELLPLEVEGVADTALQRRLGHLFVLAGAPERGAAIFRALLRTDGRSADSYAGLAEAEFVQGNYGAAAAHFRSAARLKPADPATARRLGLVAEVLALDPLRRGLDDAERDRRSGSLLQLAVQATERCDSAGVPDSVAAVVDSARRVLATDSVTVSLGQSSEAKLELAERLRSLNGAACRESPTDQERALDLVLQRLAD
jgi:tetratricopeptide (TPR) repeat protein